MSRAEAKCVMRVEDLRNEMRSGFAGVGKAIAEMLATSRRQPRNTGCLIVVGVAGFEPATSWSQTMRADQLRYTPRGR